jgi:hypothetical protein
MKDKEVAERMQDTEAVLEQQGKRIAELENKEIKTPNLDIPDYSMELNAILNELRNNNNNDKVNQLLSRIMAIQEGLKKHPVPVNKQWRVLLFPETNQGQYYKIVFGRLIPWGLAFVILTYLFIYSYKAIDKYQSEQIPNEQVQQEQVHYERAWHYLQHHAKKKTVAAMDQAWEKTGKK